MLIQQEGRKLAAVRALDSVLMVGRAAQGGRLYNQGQLLTRAMGGFFPDGTDTSTIRTVLDVACGSGAWVIDIARRYPHMEVYGVDVSSRLIEYARGLVRLRRSLSNVHFLLRDTFFPFDAFPDGFFDFIHARLMHAMMPNEAWTHSLVGCSRLLAPGGMLNIIECEMEISNSMAAEALAGVLARAMWQLGRSFSPGGRLCGATAVLTGILRHAGCVELGDQVYLVDYSSGEENAALWHETLMAFYKALHPFLVQSQAVTNEEFEELYRQCVNDMSLDDFCGLLSIRSCWGKKRALHFKRLANRQ